LKASITMSLKVSAFSIVSDNIGFFDYFVYVLNKDCVEVHAYSRLL
jgi:hypothetical protein